MGNDVTHENAVCERKKSFRKFDFQLCCGVNKCKTKKSVRRRNKKHNRTTPDVQFKEFSLTKQHTRPRTD